MNGWGNRVVIGIGVLCVAYVLAAPGVLAWLEARRTEAPMTQGSRAFGTVLKRDGVAVAELVALREIGGRDAATLNLTSHDSAGRYHEFAQALREGTPLAVLGNHLPTQTAEWVADFLAADVHTYTVVWPDLSTTAFRGFLVGVGNKGQIGDRLYWDAIIMPMQTGEYWHCTGTPSAPGTPPPDDPEHWEASTATLAGVLEGEAVFGNAGTGISLNYSDDAYIIASRYPVAGGPATHSATFETGGAWFPNWPVDLGEQLWPGSSLSIKAAYNANTGRVTRAWAYLQIVEADGETYGDIEIGIYDAERQLVGSSETVRVTVGEWAWVEFPFVDGPVASPDGAYYLALWKIPYAIGGLFVGAGTAYELPSGSEWDEDWGTPPTPGYEFCNYVHYAL